MTSSGRIGTVGLVMVILAVTACSPRSTFPPPSTCVTPGPSASSCDSEPTASATITPASPSPAPTLTPEVPPAQFAEWTRSGLPDPAPKLRGAFPIGVFMVEDRLIVVGTVIHSCCTGSDPRKHRGVIWTSRDGLSWRLHDPVASLDRATIEDVVYDGTRLVAVGRYAGPGDVDPEWQGQPATWTSTDGLNWTRSTGDAPTLIATGPHGLVGVRADPTLGDALFLRSEDGLNWTVTSSPVSVGMRQLAIDATGHALALGTAPGAPGPDDEPFDDTYVVRSQDGVTWDDPELLLPAAFPNWDGRSLVASTTGFVASVTSSITGASALWRITMDGATRLPLVVAENEHIWELAGTASALVVSWAADDGRAVWISMDGGTSWGHVPAQDALDRSVERLSQAVEFGDRLIVVGFRNGQPFHVLPVAWIVER